MSDTKTAILDTAQELIQTLGINGMSYKDISRKVGIRTASIHYHFPAKTDLIRCLMSRYNDDFLALVDDIVDSKAAALKKLKKYADLFTETLRSGKNGKVCLYGMIGAELSTLGSPLVCLVEHFYSENARRLARIIESGKESGEIIQRGDSLEQARLYFALLEGAMLFVRAGGGAPQFERLRDTFLELLKKP